MRAFPLINRGVTLPAMVTLVLMAVLAALLAGASPASAQGSAPDTPGQPNGTAVFVGGVDLEWNDVPGADSYDVQLFRNGQWTDLPGDGVEIAFYGAGAIISELDPSSTYWFHVRARNAHGSSDWSDYRQVGSTNQSTLGKRARPDNVPASGAPVINGTVQVGETLTADTTGIEDGNGLDRVQLRFQWVTNDGSADAEITGGTDSSYTLVAADEGKTVKVRVSFTDRRGYAESLTSDATDTVSFAVQQQVANSPATGVPTITGTAQVGETLTADTSGIADADSLANVSYSYQWVRNDGTSDTDITGATDSTYTLVAADEGKTIRVRVSFTDDADNSETLTSAATAEVAAAPADPRDVIDLGDITDLGGPSLINDSVEKHADTEDWLSFTLTAIRSVTLILGEQDYNADLILEDETGNELYASRDLGDGGDYINADLEPGTYYIRVEAVEDGENEYVLHYETWPVAETANLEVKDAPLDSSLKNVVPGKGPGESEDSEPALRDHGTSPELGTGDLPGPPTTSLDYTDSSDEVIDVCNEIDYYKYR